MFEAEDDVTDRCPPLKRTTEANSSDVGGRPHEAHLSTVFDRQFTPRQHLNIHASSQATDSTYCCPHCEISFLSQHSLVLHMNIHSVKYKCTECGRCCHSSYYLAVHRRSHSGEKPFECTVCSKRFTTSGSLVRHSRIHSGEKPYKCHVCDKAFGRSGHLNTHMRVHTGEKPLKCSLCDKSFSTSSSLQRHRRRVHSNSRPYECPYCGKMFKTHVELKRHVRIHTDAEPYSCRHCSHCFTWPDQLKTHLLKSHNEGTWFTCDICQMKFGSKEELKHHVQRHEAVKLYACSEFPKRFCQCLF